LRWCAFEFEFDGRGDLPTPLPRERCCCSRSYCTDAETERDDVVGGVCAAAAPGGNSSAESVAAVSSSAPLRLLPPACDEPFTGPTAVDDKFPADSDALAYYGSG
jgi:hypothetical protein